MTVGERLRAAAAQLGPAASTGRLDAELLMAEAMGVSRSDMLLRHMRDPVPHNFEPMFARRLEGEPVAYILGHTVFWTLDLAVSRDVLIPRSDSETLIAAARDMFAVRPPRHILDCGTGSGALVLAALSLFPQARGAGIDRCEAALRVARINAEKTGFSKRVRMMHRDWEEPGWARDLGSFDLILANPPYVEMGALLEAVVRDHEPAGALFAGPDGLDAYRRLLPQLRPLLTPQGAAIVEIGASQASAVTGLACDNGYRVALRHDLGGRPRAVILT